MRPSSPHFRNYDFFQQIVQEAIFKYKVPYCANDTGNKKTKNSRVMKCVAVNRCLLLVQYIVKACFVSDFHL
jgi:hypothetical protein